MPINENDLDDLLTIDEAAALIGLSRNTVYRMISERAIETVMIGSGRGRARITRRAILDAYNRRVVKAAPAKPDARTRARTSTRRSA